MRVGVFHLRFVSVLSPFAAAVAVVVVVLVLVTHRFYEVQVGDRQIYLQLVPFAVVLCSMKPSNWAPLVR